MRHKILVVVSHYYKNISKNLLYDTKLTLDKSKVKYKIIDVPGVFEMPSVIAKILKNMTVLLHLAV